MSTLLPPPAIGQHRQLRVLVADDHEDSASTLARLIQMWGHDARAVFDGRSALSCVAVFQPDVVILDILMPNLDGFELAEALRQREADTQTALIAHSAYHDDDFRRKALEVGIDHYLVKPVEPLYLRSLLAGIAEASLCMKAV